MRTLTETRPQTDGQKLPWPVGRKNPRLAGHSVKGLTYLSWERSTKERTSPFWKILSLVYLMVFITSEILPTSPNNPIQRRDR